MSRYIDIDDISLRKTISVGGLSAKALWRRIQQEPGIDIVRCKECKKAHLTHDGVCKHCDEQKDDDGNYIEVYHDGDHFCSYGERNEHGKDIQSADE